MLAGALVLLAGFASVERRSRRRSCGSGILRSAALARANLGALLFVGSFFGFQFVAVLYLQELRGWSTIETGLALAVAASTLCSRRPSPPCSCASSATCASSSAGLAIAALAYALFLPLAPTELLAMLPALCCSASRSPLPTGP